MSIVATIPLVLAIAFGAYIVVNPRDGRHALRLLLRISDGYSVGRFLNTERGTRVFGIGMIIFGIVPLAAMFGHAALR
jgi:ABC-type transport system involved in cytochrome c biogenesis permease subunit